MVLGPRSSLLKIEKKKKRCLLNSLYYMAIRLGMQVACIETKFEIANGLTDNVAFIRYRIIGNQLSFNSLSPE